MIRKHIANHFISMRHQGIDPIIKELKNTEFLEPTEIIKYQNKKLQRLIDHAYHNVSYYKELFDLHKIKPSHIKTANDLNVIPLLEKKTIQENTNSLIANNFTKYFTRTTSGSTGTPLNIHYNTENKLVEIALMFRFLSSIGKDVGSKEINLWGRPDNSTMNKLLRFTKGFLYNTSFKNVYQFKDQDYTDIVSSLIKNPNIHLRGFTQSIFMIACKLRDMKASINIDAVSVTAEKLLSLQREVIEKHLTKNLYDQYGCGETNSIAFECKCHNGLHHAFEHSILEIVTDDGTRTNENGAAVITNLDNYAMPLIRYRNGDLIRLSNKKCTCGRSSQLIDSIEGRLYDFIEGANGVKVHNAFLDHILVESDILEQYKVNEIRIIQTEPDLLVLQYVSGIEIPVDNFDGFEREVKNHLGVMKINYMRKDFLKDTKNGKRRFVIPFHEYIKDKSIL